MEGPSPMIVVKLISFSCIRSSSITTWLMAGRLSLEGSKHRIIKCMNPSIASPVKLFPNLSSMMHETLLLSWMFCTFIQYKNINRLSLTFSHIQQQFTDPKGCSLFQNFADNELFKSGKKTQPNSDILKLQK